MELSGKQEALIMCSMKLLRDQLEDEKNDDLPEIVTDTLSENIKILDELIEGLYTSQGRRHPAAVPHLYTPLVAK